MKNKCKFYISWVGECGEPCVGDFCEKHAGLRCVSCGEQATRACGDTTFGGSMVCGAPLCDSCEHSYTSVGNSHVKKL